LKSRTACPISSPSRVLNAARERYFRAPIFMTPRQNLRRLRKCPPQLAESVSTPIWGAWNRPGPWQASSVSSRARRSSNFMFVPSTDGRSVGGLLHCLRSLTRWSFCWASFNHDSAMRSQTSLSLGLFAFSDCRRHSPALSRHSSAVFMMPTIARYRNVGCRHSPSFNRTP